MYSKRLKERFKDFVLRKAEGSAKYGHVNNDMWICVFYLHGMLAAVCITENVEDYFRIDSESFRYVYNSIVELKKVGE